MEFKIERDKFLDCISRTQTIIEKTSNMPILSAVLISSEKDGLTISATDLELFFQEKVEAEIISEGKVAVSGRKLFEIIKESNGQNFYVNKEENERLFISDGNAQFRLATLPTEEFPLLLEPKDIHYVSVDSACLKDMIRKTIYTVATEGMGFKLSGIFIQKKEDENLRFVATDGHRLSLIERQVSGIKEMDLEEGILVPKKGMAEINKLAQQGGSIEIGLKDKNFIVKKDNRILIIRLLDVKFPNYEDVIPQKGELIILIDRIRFIEALRRMLIFSIDKYRAVRIVIKEKAIELFSTNTEIGEAFEKIEIKQKGKKIKDKLEIIFNPKFFIDALQSMESESVELSFIDKDKPCIIKGEDDPGFLALIMPMRL